MRVRRFTDWDTNIAIKHKIYYPHDFVKNDNKVLKENISRYNIDKYFSPKAVFALGHKRKMIASRIFNDFYRLVVEDMVENNTIFKIPLMKGKGEMMIGASDDVRVDHRSLKKHDYYDLLLTQGLMYMPILKLPKSYNGYGRYKVRFSKKMRGIMKDKILNGRRYFSTI